MTETEPVQKDPLDLNFLVDRCKTLFLSPPSSEKGKGTDFYSVMDSAQSVVEELITKGHSPREIAIRLTEQTSLMPEEIPTFTLYEPDSWDAFWTDLSEQILQLETEKAFPDYEQIEEQRGVLGSPF